MANKLGINRPRPADLASLSAYPSLHDRSVSRPNNVQRYSSSQRDSTSRRAQAQAQAQPTQSLLYSVNSQSQQSFSQGVTFSQPFSQLSQDDPATAFEEWRCNREGRPFSGIPPARPSESLQPEDSSRKLPVSRTSSLIQRLNSRSFPETNSHAVSEELDKRLEVLDEGLSKVITMLDSVQGDLQKLSKAVQNASFESEGIKQKMMLQESSLQLLLKEEEKIKKTLTTGLNKLLEQKTDASNLESLFSELHSIPAALTRNLSMIKTDMFTCIRNELQTVRECIKSRKETWTPAETLPYDARNAAKVASQKGMLPASKKKPSPKVPVTRKRQRRKAASPTVKPPRMLPTSKPLNAPGTANTMQRSGWRSLDWKADDVAPPVIPVVRNTRARQSASKKLEAASVAMQYGDAFLATTEPTVSYSSLPITSRAKGNSAVLEEKGWIATKPIPAQHPKFNKTIIMNEKVQSSNMDKFTFEMEEEEGECFFSPEDTSSKTEYVSRGLVELQTEDELRNIRQKMMKARRKRERSTCISLCD